MTALRDTMLHTGTCTRTVSNWAPFVVTGKSGMHHRFMSSTIFRAVGGPYLYIAPLAAVRMQTTREGLRREGVLHIVTVGLIW